jgi:hypothetical protein
MRILFERHRSTLKAFDKVKDGQEGVEAGASRREKCDVKEQPMGHERLCGLCVNMRWQASKTKKKTKKTTLIGTTDSFT